MATDPKRLLELAEAVADGRLVDWPSAESSAQTRAEQELIAQLRLLAGVVDVHRSGGDGEAGPETEAHTGGAFQVWRGLEIRALIGAGSFGRVYRAHDPRLGRDVALKLLNANDAPVTASAIIEEGRRLARVRHPHVITVFGADRHEGRVGIWMELVQGRTLEALLADSGPFSPREAAIVGEELCSALAAVHAAGLVHRDVKAHNVMRESGGRVVLMDFGAGEDHAPQASSSLRTTGTPLYMAPELFEGATATPSTDLYSLGVLIFRLVTGDYPVEGRTAAEVQEAHRSGRRKRLRDLRPDLPARFIAVIERALAHDPRERFATAGAMQEALAAAFQAPRSRSLVPSRRVLTATAILLVLALVVSGRRVREALWPTTARTLAVMPFTNVTGDSAADHLASGIADLVISRLHATEGLRVIPPSSTAGLAADPDRVSKAGRQLDADHVLEASVEARGGRLRVSVRLIAAGSGALRWSQTYERRLTDPFSVQGEIAAEVARSLSLSVRPGGVPAARLYTTSAEAQDAYLRGRHLLYRFDRSVLPEMRQLFERAVALDPQFALAQASLARAYLMVEAYGLAPLAEVGPLALEAARRAVEIAPELSEGHVALAEVFFKAQRDWQSADGAFRRAVALAPNASVVRSPFARFLSAAGHPDEALEHARAGLAADPLSAEMAASVGITEYYLRRFGEALETFNQVTQSHPRYGPGFFGRARARSALGQHEAAIADIKQALALSGGETSYHAEMARVYAVAGWRNSAEQVLGELLALARAGQRAVAPHDLAWVYAALGDHDRAFSFLDAALDANETRVLFIRVDPRADPLRSDPRFERLLDKLDTIHR